MTKFKWEEDLEETFPGIIQDDGGLFFVQPTSDLNYDIQWRRGYEYIHLQGMLTADQIKLIALYINFINKDLG